MPKKGGIPWNKGKSKYPQLNDRDWLYQKYWIEKQSLNQIAKLVGGGCSRDTVRYAMKHFDISCRTLSEAQEGIYLYPIKREDAETFVLNLLKKEGVIK